MRKVIKIVNYAINGSGVGHLTRLVGINRWIRRYAAHAGVRAEIYFLTSSEADHLLFPENFASFKIPSKTVVGETGIDKTTYLALAKQWIWHSIGLIRPDLLVVDTFPRGSFGELLSTLDLCERRAFIYRPLKKGFALRPDFQAMLPLYDAIIVPDEARRGDLPVPDSVRHRVVHTGPAMAREKVEFCDRKSIREQLAVPDDRLAVYVSAGGGGDSNAENRILEIIAALGSDPAIHLVVGAGPLYRGKIIWKDRIVWLVEQRAAEMMPGFDIAVCPAGYNTFFELMLAGVPTIFLPQEKIADDQRERAERAKAVGAGIVLEQLDELRAAVETLKDPEKRRRAKKAALSLVPQNHARDIAAELLQLLLPLSMVEAARAAVTDELLGTAGKMGYTLEPFLEIIKILEPQDPSLNNNGHATALAIEMAQYIQSQQIPMTAALRILAALGRKTVHGSIDGRKAAGQCLLTALAPFNDWTGAVTLMKVFAMERQLSPQLFVDELNTFLRLLMDQNRSLYSGIEYLSTAGGTEQNHPSNRELLRIAAQRCQ